MATQSVNRSSPIAYSCTNLLELHLDPLRCILKLLPAEQIFTLRFVCKKFAAIDLVKNAKPKQQDLILLAVKTSLVFVKWIMPLITLKHLLFPTAARYGNLPLLKWLKIERLDPKRKEEDPLISFKEATRGDHLETIEWLRAKGYNNGHYIRCILNDDLELKNWRCSNCPPKEHSLVNSAKFGDLENLKRFMKRVKLPSLYHCHFKLSKRAASSGNLEMVKWLYEIGFCWASSAPLAAIKGGHLEILKFYVEKTDDKQFTFYCTKAAKYGRLEILQWLRANGFAWNEKTFLAAANQGNLEILKWLYAEKCPFNEETFLQCIRLKKLEILKWLYEVDCPFHIDAIEYTLAYSLPTAEWQKTKNL